MSLFRAPDPDDQHDVLASNLLFATIGLTILLQVSRLLPHEPLAGHKDFGRVVAIIGFFLLLRGILYYAIRRGLLAAKLFFALVFVGSVYTDTSWQNGYVAGVNFAHFNKTSALVLGSNLLMLAALALMFAKPRVAAR